ncbi:MAG: ribose-phosphate diphosphokinase [Culicoidibacterales bacterium]
MASQLQIFTLTGNPELAAEIAAEVGIPLSPCIVNRFADGETMVDIKESVRGNHVYIVQPTCAPVNERLMELLIMIDALKRASAKTINVVMPYFGYARQDRKSKSREPITAKLVANLIVAAGCTRLITMDLHASQIQGFFDIPIDDFRAMPIIAKYFLEKGLDKNELVVVSPDHGGATRARRFAEVLDAPLAIIDKRRPKPNVAEVVGIIGEVKGKKAIIIDDMIDTAGSICNAVSALLEKGATEVYTACTHPLLSGPAIERIRTSEMIELVTTNTVPLAEGKHLDKITQLSIGPILGKAIKHIYTDQPVSDLFGMNVFTTEDVEISEEDNN